MFANHARAAELHAARARRAQEAAARAEDEQDHVPESTSATLEQFIVPGNKTRMTGSSRLNGGSEDTSRISQNLDATSQVTSEYEDSDSATDQRPNSGHASVWKVAPGTQPSERMIHSYVRPSFSRTAQGYETPSIQHSSPQVEPATREMTQQQPLFNPQAAHFSRPTRNVNDDPFTENWNNAYPSTRGFVSMGQANATSQPPIRVTIPNVSRFTDHVQCSPNNLVEYQSTPGESLLHIDTIPATRFRRDPRPFTSFAVANGYRQLHQQLDSLAGMNGHEGARETLGSDLALGRSGLGSQSSMQASYYQPAPIGLPPVGGRPTTRPSSGSNSDLPELFPWTQRHGNLFREPSVTVAETCQPSGTSNSKSLRLPPGLHVPTGAHLPAGPHSTTDTAQSRSLRDAEDWWYRELQQRQDLHQHLADVARTDPFNQTRHSQDTRSLGSKGASSDGFRRPDPEGIGMAARGLGDQALLVAALSQLQSYVTGSDTSKHRRFGQYNGQVGEWCLDKGPGGNGSFYGDKWGAPPARVGRDPRYRTTLHEGRYTVFEEKDRRSGRV